MTARPPPDLDIICIGRAAVDLYGEQIGARLEDVQTFAKYLGGSPGNTAYGCARLGLRAAMLTRVGDEHNGRFVRETLAAAGVDVSHVTTDPARLTGLVFLAIRDRDTFPLIFYRDNCADMAISEGDIDAAFIARARAVLISGTHLSKPGVHAACMKAILLARELGVKVVLDIDYRPVLWGLTSLGDGETRFIADEGVSTHLQRVAVLCDLIVGTEEEINIAGGASDVAQSLHTLRGLTAAVIVLKRGPHGCVVYDGPIPARLDEGIAGPGFPVEVFNVLGAGDSFMAGFLRGWLRDQPLARCAELANACGAITVSRHGCAPAMATWTELEWFLAQAKRGFPSKRLWTNAEFEHVHRATTREREWRDLAVFGFDHRLPFAAMPNATPARITQFKQLALQAALGAQGGAAKGVLLDDRYGDELLPRLTGTGLWTGRPVERPHTTPLRFDIGPDIGTAVRAWPKHHVAKCALTAHPSLAPGVQSEQIEYLAMLQHACRASGHEWLLELLPPEGVSAAAAESAACMRALYAAGLRPDWWALPAAPSAAAWSECFAVIEQNDPYCLGILLLGTEFAGLPRAVRGFMAGRAIFATAAQAWFEGTLADDAAIAQMQARYEAVIAAWRTRVTT